MIIHLAWNYAVVKMLDKIYNEWEMVYQSSLIPVFKQNNI